MSQQVKTSGGRKINSARKFIEVQKLYDIEEAVRIAKNSNYAKFDANLDIAINLGIDPRQSDQNVRGVTVLPHGTGKNVKVAVICKTSREEEAQNAGADFYNSQNIIDDIKKGKIEFDICIATPDMMGIVGSVAKILGPKKLMPNPKLGTVTTDIAKAVNNAKSGQVEFRSEKGGVIHAGIGKLSFADENLISNIKSFISAVNQAKPATSKGVFLRKIHLSSTMGIGIPVSIDNILI